MTKAIIGAQADLPDLACHWHESFKAFLKKSSAAIGSANAPANRDDAWGQWSFAVQGTRKQSISHSTGRIIVLNRDIRQS